MANSVSKSRLPLSDTAPGRGSGRELLLEAASALMRERDSLELTLSEIAVRANLNAALVKYYFGNKQGLMIALLDRDLSQVMPQMGILLANDMPPSRKMRAHIVALVGLYFKYPYLNRLMMEIIRDGSEDISRHIADTFLKPINDFYQRLIADGVKAGEFQDIDPKLFYFSIVGACDPFISARFVLKFVHGIDQIDDELRQRYAQQTAQILMDGLLGGKSKTSGN